MSGCGRRRIKHFKMLILILLEEMLSWSLVPKLWTRSSLGAIQKGPWYFTPHFFSSPETAWLAWTRVWLLRLTICFIFSSPFSHMPLWTSLSICKYIYIYLYINKQQCNGYWHDWSHVPVCRDSRLISWTSHSYSSTAGLSPVYGGLGEDRYTAACGFESTHRKLLLCIRPAKIICL